MTTVDPPPPRRRMNAEARRAQIVAAAREVFIEQGANGARSRHIAERAGITEAYLYRHFRSKDEIYRLAIEAPLRELLDRLENETRELAEREGVSRTDVLYRCHELFCEYMPGIAPLVAAELFSGSDGGREFYADFLLPALRSVIESTIADISGWPVEAFELDVIVQAQLGVHLGLSLLNFLDDRELGETPDVARQLVAMFAPPRRPRR